MGVPLVRMKLSRSPAAPPSRAPSGVLFSAKQIFINPESFTFMESIGVLAMIILGGMGSIPGAILGAAVVTMLNLQVLKGLSLWLNELRNAGVTVSSGYDLANLPTQLEPAKYERMVFGLILVLMMIFRPQGILPARRRSARARREDPEPLLEARAVTQALRRADRAEHGWTSRSRKAHRLDHRSQRGGQDDLLQRLHRDLRAGGRRRHLPGHAGDGPPARPDHRARHLPHLPEHPPLPPHDRDRERARGHARAGPLGFWDV